MEKNDKLRVEVAVQPAQDAEKTDAILLCHTKAGNGFKVAHNGKWYYAARYKVMNLIERKKENCLFVTIEDQAEPTQTG